MAEHDEEVMAEFGAVFAEFDKAGGTCLTEQLKDILAVRTMRITTWNTGLLVQSQATGPPARSLRCAAARRYRRTRDKQT
jgi:hypothetical protein